MRLGLAAKLCLLAATLVFCATGAAGALFFKGARDVVRQRELAGLRDEAELRRRELLADYDRARADLLALAGSPAARAVSAAESRRGLESQALRLLEARPHYREVIVIADESGANRAVARAERREDGPRVVAPTGSPAGDVAADLANARRLSPADVSFSEVRPAARRTGAPADAPALEQVAVAPVTGPAGETVGFVVLRIDFTALVRPLNQSPRTLGFLVNARGEYLAHPDPARVLGGA